VRALAGTASAAMKPKKQTMTAHAKRSENILRLEANSVSVTWGRCCDHNFRRFLPSFGGKNDGFSQNFAKTSRSLSKRHQYFCQ
jgi:hypothetical protein